MKYLHDNGFKVITMTDIRYDEKYQIYVHKIIKKKNISNTDDDNNKNNI